MTIKDLLAEEVDIDVVDTYDERCWIAFVGPCKLKAKGKKRFADILDLPVQHHGNVVALLTDSAAEAEECKNLFYAHAGYCSERTWDEWFKEA